jgi:hypothetical protein
MAYRLTHKTSEFISQQLPSGVVRFLFSVLRAFTSYQSRAYKDRSSQTCPLVLSLMFCGGSTLTALLSALVTTNFHNDSFSKLTLFHNDHPRVVQQFSREVKQ